MKKLFVTAIMAIALIAGSATVYADNDCQSKCDKAKTECVKAKDCAKKAECTNDCKAEKCTDCKGRKAACKQDVKCKDAAKCKKTKADCKKAKQCNKPSKK